MVTDLRPGRPFIRVVDAAGVNPMTVNPDGSINVTGSFVGTNPSVGTTGAAAPTSATEIGTIDGSGNLQAASATNPVPISGFVYPAISAMVTGAASSTAGTSTQLIAAVASKSLYITGFSLSNTSATTITLAFQDGSGGATLWTAIIPAGGGHTFSCGGAPMFKTTSGNGLFFAASIGETTIYANACGFSA